MMKLHVSAFALFLAVTPFVCASDFEDLASRIPGGANTLVAIDVDRVLESEVAKANGWGSRTGAADRPLYLPPEADKVVVAAQVDPPRQFARSWEVAMMGLKQQLPMSLVARAEGGYTDTINGKPAAWVPSDAYFVEVAPTTMGLMFPANRQAVSRWISRQEAGTNVGISDYLRAAIDKVEVGPQIVVAIDTQDLGQGHRLEQRLSESEVVANHKLDVAKLVPLMASLKGLSMGITATDKVRATGQIDFGQPVTFSSAAAKSMVLQALTDFQAELPGVDKWDYTVSENSILFGGEMDTAALRRILSLLEIPSTKFSSLKGEDTEASSEDLMREKSLVYFHKVTDLVTDLEKQTKTSRGNTYWFDRYSTKIDRLPILHVDPELLDFGEKTAQTLRVMSGSRKGANIQGGLAMSNTAASGGSRGYDNGYRNYNNSYRNSGYGGRNAVARAHRDLSSDIASVNATKARAAAGATSTKIQGFKLIKDATVKMRRTLTERYNVEF